jgi:hypothetical protein
VWSRRMNRTDASEVYLSMTHTRDDRGERQMSAYKRLRCLSTAVGTPSSHERSFWLSATGIWRLRPLTKRSPERLERWPEYGTFDNPEGWVYRVGVNWAKTRIKKRVGHFDWAARPGRVNLDDLPEPELSGTAVESIAYQIPGGGSGSILFGLVCGADRSASLDIPKGTVKTRQARAIRSLKRQIRRFQ